MHFVDDFVVDDLLTFFIFLEENLLQMSSGLEVITVYFGFTEFGVLEFSIINFTEFGVLELLWNSQNTLYCVLARLKFPCLLFLFLELA